LSRNSQTQKKPIFPSIVQGTNWYEQRWETSAYLSPASRASRSPLPLSTQALETQQKTDKFLRNPSLTLEFAKLEIMQEKPWTTFRWMEHLLQTCVPHQWTMYYCTWRPWGPRMRKTQIIRFAWTPHLSSPGKKLLSASGVIALENKIFEVPGNNEGSRLDSNGLATRTWGKSLGSGHKFFFSFSPPGFVWKDLCEVNQGLP
jgi:hypothetical protein